MKAASSRSVRRRVLDLALLVAAAACYLGVVTARQGPPSGGDTVPLTTVTSDLAAGHLGSAAAATTLPNPPGYALLTAPLAAAFGSLVGSPVWCTTAGRATSLRKSAAYRGPDAAEELDECGSLHARPPWYRAQGILGVAAWLVLALGSLALLRAGGSDSIVRRAGLLAFLAFLPAASSAVVQLFHPQDVVSLGLALGGLAQTLYRRWVLAGALFGAALLTKQFAVLLLLPALVAAPDLRARLRVAVPTMVVFGAGILPFLVSNPRATLDNVSGFSAGGAVAGSTVLSLSGVTGSVASAVARDAPVAFAVAVCLWAAHRWGPLRHPRSLVALALACAGSRLVFESVVFPYYLLAASVLYLLLDLVARRSPYRSLSWCAAAAFFVALRPDNQAVDAFGTLLLAVASVAAGLIDLARTEESPALAET